MGVEIERKFLVINDNYKNISTERHEILQGYLNTDPDRTVRIRIFDSKGFITIKTRNVGALRHEWEFEIPLSEAKEIANEACSGLIEKTRYIVPADNGLKWEIDEFHGKLSGLVLAEIELPGVESPFALPSFIGKEVTADPAYYNSTLSALI